MAKQLLHNGRIMQLFLRDENGVDLVVLDICGPNMGAQGICLLSNFSGLMHAPRTPVRESWAYQEGSTPSDFPRVDERMVDLRLGVKGDTPALWEQIENLLWTVLGFKHDAYLRWYHADGIRWRELKVRLDRKPSDKMIYEPGVTAYMVWDITLVACDPWWYSTTLTDSWTRGSTPLVGGKYSGTLTLQNPADQECWLQFSNDEITTPEIWTLPDGIAVYPSGHANAGQPVTHTLPMLGAGLDFLVDTHPLAETLMVMDDSQQWAKMRAESWLYSLPPHTPPTVVPVSLVGGTTASRVEVYMKQRWDRPTGGEAL